MYIFSPNTLIKSAEINANFAELIGPSRLSPETVSATWTNTTFTSSTTSAFQDTGLNITLTNAGTWVVLANVRCSITNATQRFSILRLYNTTTATEVANSLRISHYFEGTTTGWQPTVPINEIITTTTANNVIRLDVKPAGAYTTSVIGDTNGYTTLRAYRIG